MDKIDHLGVYFQLTDESKEYEQHLLKEKVFPGHLHFSFLMKNYFFCHSFLIKNISFARALELTVTHF